MNYFDIYQEILILFVITGNCVVFKEVFSNGYEDRDTLKIFLTWCIFMVISFGLYVYFGGVK